jgi:hypothetical protein
MGKAVCVGSDDVTHDITQKLMQELRYAQVRVTRQTYKSTRHTRTHRHVMDTFRDMQRDLLRVRVTATQTCRSTQ